MVWIPVDLMAWNQEGQGQKQLSWMEFIQISSTFLFYFGPQQIRAICFTEFANSYANVFQKHPHGHNQRYFISYLGVLWPSQVDT